MSKLEELIQKLCPNEVEYRPLGELCEIRKGKQLNKDGLLEQGNYPVINGGINPSGYWNEYNFEKDLITISQGGASAGYVNFITTKFWAGAHCYVLVNPKNCLNYRLLYHIVKNYEKELMSAQVGAGIPSVSSNKLTSLSIPVPPIEVQEEIVRILDKFTELTAELTARKKQYEYFCDKLLTQSNHISYKKVKDLAKFTYGFTDKAKDAGNVRYIRITDIDETGCLKHDDKKFLNLSENNHSYLLKKGDLVMARTGATFGKTLYFEDNEPSIYASFLIKIELDNNKILNRFYWHFSKSSLYWEQANNLVSTGGQPQFNTGAIGQVVVPVPPLEEQKRIIAILDRFDKLCNDISEGLPAEIKARQKQYEYYREKLLQFRIKN